MTPITQHLIDIVNLGSLYAILGLGIALIFGIMRLVNFAQGELIMIGAYAATVSQGAGWVVVVVVTITIPALAALLMERVAFRPIREASDATLLVTSFAVSYLLQNVAMLAFSNTPRSINISDFLYGAIFTHGLVIPKLNIGTVAATLVSLVLLSFLFVRTTIGIQMRAAAEDFTMARTLGVRADRVIATAFALSGILCGIAAYLMVAQTGQVFPTMGANALFVAFIATTFGGLGSLVGSVVGGYALATLLVLLDVYLPENLRVYSQAFAYLCVMALLVWRPQGIVNPRAVRTRV